MGLTQDFTGLVEPDDPAFARASSQVRRRYYDEAGRHVLDELAKQLGKGIGRNGRAMKVRIQPVLPDGADGPVMEPHYDASRVITLADYSVTDHSLKLWWHAGTGHASHRKAREKGQKPKPFGDILGYHAEGLVPHAPVRDVRLCNARIANVRRLCRPLWDRLKTTVRAPAPAPKPTPAPFPKPAPQPAVKLKPGESPAPSSPIPVFTKMPTKRPPGRFFVVTGAKGTGGAKVAKQPPPPPPKPVPATVVPKPVPPVVRVTPSPVPRVGEPIPPRPAPGVAPEWARMPTPTPTAPQAFTPRPAPMPPVPKPEPQTPLETAVAYGESMGFRTRVSAKYFETKLDALAIYTIDKSGNEWIMLNPNHRSWKTPEEYMSEKFAKNWFSSAHPEHTIRHEVAHGLHARKIGLEDFKQIDDRFKTIEDVQVARRVSKYAATNGFELVAEVYAGRQGGREFDADVMRLYHQFGGPSLGFSPRGSSPVL